MQFSLGRNREPSSQRSASNSSTTQNNNARSDAMQRAIERNRAKMQKRSAPIGASASTPPPTPGMRPSASSPNSNSSVLAKLRAQRDARAAGNSATSAAGPSTKPMQASSAPSSMSSGATRRPITQPDNIEMSSPLRKKTTAPAAVNYADQTPARSLTKSRPSVTAKRKVKAKSKKKTDVTGWGVKLCWGFCLFLLGRLIFSQGGVIEYLDKKSTLDQAYHEVTLLTQENEGLMKELQLIRTNNRYKKKLVRDHLGYIARDEYLILFPENAETAARGVSSI